MKARLIERIRQDGPITWETFVETALYDEREGYYRAGKVDRVDYYTAPELNPLFGRTIARYIEEYCDGMGLSEVTIVEPAGASGRLARQILSGLDHLNVERYYIVDKGQERKDGPLEWVNTFDGVGSLGGRFVFVVANEFFDALPFHRVVRLNDGLREIRVGHDQGFFEELYPLSEDLARFLERYPLHLQEGQTLEVTTSSLALMQGLSNLVEKGCFLVFDYGYHEAEITQGRFFEGSLLGYRDRQIRQDFFDQPGTMDITHHVNFDHLAVILADLGWRKEGETEQSRFLQHSGILELLAAAGREERMSAMWLINPEGLGSMISVLAFSRGAVSPMPGFGRGRL